MVTRHDGMDRDGRRHTVETIATGADSADVVANSGCNTGCDDGTNRQRYCGHNAPAERPPPSQRRLQRPDAGNQHRPAAKPDRPRNHRQ